MHSYFKSFIMKPAIMERMDGYMRKKLPIGIDGFEKIRTNHFYYVDKTKFIADLLHNWGEVNLFTRPRRFGKSLNISMLKFFFEIGSNPALFEGLAISREKELCDAYMGKLPVISINLKSVEGLSFKDACDALRSVVGMEAMRFSFLESSSRLSDNEKEMYRALIKVENGMFTMPDSALLTSLKVLSQLLAKHYGKSIILLIDEYDVPLDQAFRAGYYDRMAALIRSLFGNVLKTNDDLLFAVLTGCLRISKESIFTGLNNLKVHTITDSRYDEYFGFTDDDVSEMLAFYGLTSHKDVIRDWYDGYLFGRTSLYCPWDVINYCDELLSDAMAKPKNYWANTSGNTMVRRFIDKADKNTKDEIESLLAGEIIHKPVKQELTYKELDLSIDNLWSVLFSTGYLTRRQSSSDEGDELSLIIPNREIRNLFIDLVNDWFKETSRANPSKIEKFCQAFPEGNVSLIGEMLRNYLWDSISVRDTAVRRDRKENFYHGLLLGLLQSQGDWLIKSNAELGEGYSDIFICTPDKTGIVIELKYAEDGRLQKACADALSQIEKRKYALGLTHKGMQKILKYGIAFCEKECMAVIG